MSSMRSSHLRRFRSLRYEGARPAFDVQPYTACVYHLYETDLPLNTVAQAVLGHEDLEESSSYANVRLRDAGEPGRLGTLEYQFTDMTDSESNSDGYESE